LEDSIKKGFGHIVKSYCKTKEKEKKYNFYIVGKNNSYTKYQKSFLMKMK